MRDLSGSVHYVKGQDLGCQFAADGDGKERNEGLVMRRYVWTDDVRSDELRGQVRGKPASNADT